MEKKNLETFIEKYSLGGTLESVLWTNDNDDIVVTAMTSTKTLFASVRWEKAAFFKGVKIGLDDTSKFKKLLTPLSDDITLSLDMDENNPTRVRQVFADDGKITSMFVASGEDVIDRVPIMKNIPQFTVEIIIPPEFVDVYNKSFSGIDDKDALFTLIMSKKKQKMEMVLGWKQKNLSDRIALPVTTTVGKDTVKNPISFNARHLKEILSANSEVNNAVLSVSEAGLAGISFSHEQFKSQYYLVKINTED